MELLDVYWTNNVNMLVINCDCGKQFDYPSNYSLIECPECGYKEIWHEDGLNIEELKGYKLVKIKL